MSQSTISDTAKMLATLVSYDTTSRLSNLVFLDFCTDLLSPLGFRLNRIFNDDRTKANLFATIGPETDGGIVLSGHTDVVPVDGQNWETPPFEMTVKGTRAFGRGTTDMKGFLASALALAPAMANASLTRPIHLAFSYDEEVGCIGVRSMIDHIVAAGIRPDLAIVGEPSMMKVVDAHKSISSFTTRITGFEAHSSRTHEGVNAIEIAAELITFLKQIAGELRARGDETGRFYPPYTTLSVGIISGGTALNIVPGSCEFMWEYRSLPNHDLDEIINRFEAHCADVILPDLKKANANTDIVTFRRSRAPGLKQQDPSSTAEAMMFHFAGSNATEAVSYATEGGLFQAADIPTFVCGPGDIAQAHKPNEFVELDQLDQCDAMIGRIIDRLSVKA